MISDRLKETPSQTAGPYVLISFIPAAAGLETRSQERPNVISAAGGVPTRIEGVVYDGAGALVRDAVLEIWQADASGTYRTEGFSSLARAATDMASGLYFFETVKPGGTVARDGKQQAPFIDILIFARGLNIHLHTRLYFPEESEANAADPVLLRVDPARRPTLIAVRSELAGGPVYRFDIRLQGDQETVFFDA